jgi:hypothetical protein
MKGTKLFAGLFVVALTMVVFVSSCSKSSTVNPNAVFLGTYYGNISAGTYNYADTIVMTAGSNSSSVIMLSKWSNGLSNTINASASGTTLSIASQTVSFGNNTDTVSGTGALVSPVLTLNYTSLTPSGNTVNWSFTGDKQ